MGKQPMNVCPTCGQFSLGPALSCMFWRRGGESLPCACNGTFSNGDIIRTKVSVVGQNGQRLGTGSRGFVLAGSSQGNGMILAEFDEWAGGTDGECQHAKCGECSPWGRS